MARKTKDELTALIASLPDAAKADIFSLHTEIEEHETTIRDLTKKVKDSDEIVKNAPALEKERTDLKTKTTELESKLAALTGQPVEETDYGAFTPIFRVLGL